MKESDAEFFCTNPIAVELYTRALVSALSGSTFMTLSTKNIVDSAHEIAVAACRRVVLLRNECKDFK